MLEDDFTYVLRKALAGHGLTPEQAGVRARLTDNEVRTLLNGTFDAASARQLAPIVGLNPDALASHNIYQPRPLDLVGIARLDLPFGTEQVNAWLVTDDNVSVLFDAGGETSGLLEAVAAHGIRLPDMAFITHAHRDHIGVLEHLLGAGVPVYAAGISGTLAMRPGDMVNCGQLAILACDLSGHASPALGFHIDGMEQPVLVTGDALFAGSMGGCATPAVYQHALHRLREVLGPLPDATVILPGHGPATTLGEERTANPFL